MQCDQIINKRGTQLCRLPDQPLAGKPVLIQTSSMGVIGGARCQYHLRQILVFLDAMVMNKPEFMGGVIQNKVDPQTGEVIDQGTLDHLTGQLTAFGRGFRWRDEGDFTEQVLHRRAFTDHTELAGSHRRCFSINTVRMRERLFQRRL